MFNTNADPLFAAMVPPKRRSLFETDPFPTTHHFKVGGPTPSPTTRVAACSGKPGEALEELTKPDEAAAGYDGTALLQVVMVAQGHADSKALENAVAAESEGEEPAGGLSDRIKAALLNATVGTEHI